MLKDLDFFCKLLIDNLIQVPEWNLVNEDGVMKLHRTWKVKTFMRGLELFQRVADVAEAEGIKLI